LAEEPTINEAFLREVDDELRRSELLSFWTRWGRWLIGGVGALLALFGGYLWWQNHKLEVAGQEGEKYAQVVDAIATGKTDEATKGLKALEASGNDGVRASAELTQAAMMLDKGDIKAATTQYARVAGDTSLSKPWRDLALVRQTAAELDTLKPEDVIARLKPLSAPGNPWHGSAGEMVAISWMKLGKPNLAASVFAELAKDETVPSSIRERAAPMALQLGADTKMMAKEPK
jgi:hypothetical protein